MVRVVLQDNGYECFSVVVALAMIVGQDSRGDNMAMVVDVGQLV